MVIKFKPIALEKVWGGNKLSKLYNINGKNIGEIWGISAHKSYSNMIANGQFKGLSFRELYSKNKELFGDLNEDEFPLLFKVIDASGDLSIQVHPDDQYASKHENSYGKDECWYILETNAKNTEIIIGHNADSLEELINSINNNQTEEVVNKFRIKKGDYFYIPSGTVHAICKDTTLLEVSQSSDITYRLYDYNRLDNGKLRELHIDKSLDVMTIPAKSVQTNHNPKFFTFDININQSSSTKDAHIHGDYLYIIEGYGFVNEETINQGDFLMISSMDKYTIEGTIKYALINISIS